MSGCPEGRSGFQETCVMSYTYRSSNDVLRASEELGFLLPNDCVAEIGKARALIRTGATVKMLVIQLINIQFNIIKIKFSQK